MKKADKLCAREKCTGCLACQLSCNMGAIKKKSDHLGFYYPFIDTEKCIECGNCVKHCHIMNPISQKKPFVGYEFYSQDDSERISSSSGAFFPLVARHFMKQGYHVCGVVYNEDYLSVKYVVTESWDTVDKMRKSKYVEADLSDSYKTINDLLNDGERVLFVGLPCHVAGLLKTVKSNENLFTIDLFCFGNGSPYLYRESMIHFLKSQKPSIDFSELRRVDFRHKPFAYNSHTVMDIETKSKKFMLKADELPYYRGFVNQLVFRQSCYDCRYKTDARVGDLSIGDVIGEEDPLGRNIILVNSEKGKKLVDSIINKGNFRELSNNEMEKTAKRFTKYNIF